MTADRFRRIALRLPGVVEAAHMGHPDFRVGKRIAADEPTLASALTLAWKRVAPKSLADAHERRHK